MFLSKVGKFNISKVSSRNMSSDIKCGTCQGSTDPETIRKNNIIMHNALDVGIINTRKNTELLKQVDELKYKLFHQQVDTADLKIHLDNAYTRLNRYEDTFASIRDKADKIREICSEEPKNPKMIKICELISDL